MLDDLDRRIVGALQVDGRAPWRRVAEVLGEPERTVSRRGTVLLDSGVVVVSGWHTPGAASIVSVRSTPQTVKLAASALAHRPDTTFTYTLTGPVDCVTEIRTAPGSLPALIHDDLPGTPGLVAMSTLPVMRYFRTGFQWQPDLITPEQAAALREIDPPPQSPDHPATPLSRDDRAILRTLATDGRMPYDKVARTVGVSEATARRRVEALRHEGKLTIRAVVEPQHLGLPVEAVLWIKASPGNIDEIGESLAHHSSVRYAAAIMGEYQLLADVIVSSRNTLHEFITRSPALLRATAVDTTLVITALKRSGVLAQELRSAREPSD
jgi:DNA-binding Lrp family transcriptional regulator